MQRQQYVRTSLHSQACMHSSTKIYNRRQKRIAKPSDPQGPSLFRRHTSNPLRHGDIAVKVLSITPSAHPYPQPQTRSRRRPCRGSHHPWAALVAPTGWTFWRRGIAVCLWKFSPWYQLALLVIFVSCPWSLETNGRSATKKSTVGPERGAKKMWGPRTSQTSSP